MKSSLTPRYALHQMPYWAAAAGVVSFASGNFAGGQLLEFFGVTAMLAAGVGMAAAGTASSF